MSETATRRVAQLAQRRADARAAAENGPDQLDRPDRPDRRAAVAEPAPGSGTGDVTRSVPRFPLRIAGLGAALPRRRVSNHELAARLDTSDAWIVGRTGIKARHIAGPAETTTALASEAGSCALADAGLTPSSVDLVLVATATPDSACPATAARVAAQLGLRAGGFDINGACSGFVQAFHIAAALLADPSLATILVIGADRMSTLIDPGDRGTAILFGDGAGAAVLTRGDTLPGAPGVLGTDIGGDATGVGVIEVPPGGPFLTMDGPELFRRATRGLVTSASAALGRAGATAADVDVYVPHQANARIIGAAADRLGIPADRVVLDVAERANTSAASIPLALEAAHRRGVLRPGSRVLVSGIGAGLAWSSVFLRWGR
ncbi:MAG: fabH [Acidimicrobiales bacterium]|nr:fabH [Acidimicrobiales bacterium]